MSETGSDDAERRRFAEELRAALTQLETINARLGTSEELPGDLERAQDATHRIMNLNMGSRRWTEPPSSREKMS